MIRGFYTAASGLVSEEKRLNNIANNIANVSTTGYKRDNLVLGTFGEHLTIRRNAYQNAGYEPVGPGVYMTVVDGNYTDFTQGGFEATTRPFDLSIMGDGYFVITDDEGGEFLTRDGQFSLDEEGYLILPGFGRVQGANGDIEIGTSAMTVDGRGRIFVADEDGEANEIDQLQIALPEDYMAMEKVSNSLWSAEAADYTLVDLDGEGDAPLIRQYHLERSNANMSDEMTNMIASQRHLQSCSQIVKMYDQMAEQISTQVSRVQR